VAGFAQTNGRLTSKQIRRIAFALIHSLTLLLPAWKKKQAEMGFKEKSMHCDVSTRWNSTYNMLDFAVEHQKVINAMTNDIDNNLRAYEMSTREWGFAQELRDVLKVRERLMRHFGQAKCYIVTNYNIFPDFQRGNFVFLSR
jgi:hypothetical protein